MDDSKFILIVDDDVELGDLLAMAVEDISDSYVVKVARNVDEAMVQVRRSQTTGQGFDMVITDIKMAGLTGLEFLEALAAIAPDTRTVTMTAYNSPDLARRAEELGVFAYMTKPFIISELRELVQSALEPAPAQAQPQPTSSDPALTPAQRSSVIRQLASLRTLSGAIAALLLHNSGIVLATDDLEPNAADMSQLGEALMDTDQTLSKLIRQTFGEGSPIRQSYFGTETYNVCTYRLDKARVAAVAFGPTVKEGQVWYYIREMVPALKEALETDSEKPVERQRQKKRDVFEMLDQFFPDRHETEAVPETAHTVAIQTPPEVKDGSDAAAPTADLSALDEIDWDAPVSTDWETLSADADQSLEGITYEEAQQQGLIAPDLIERPEQAEPSDAREAATPPVGLPSVDEIDWQVSADMDWETFIADTDQGLEGIDFEEARKRGLVDGLDSQTVQTP